MRKFILSILFVLLCSVMVFSQMPSKPELHVGYRKDWSGGFTLHSSGWGLNVSRGKFKTYKRSNMLSFDLATMKHPKEYRVLNTFDEDSKSYVYGKLNSFFMIRAGYGYRHMLYEKLRPKGIDIFFKFIAGPTIGFAKPVYLKVIKLDANGHIIDIVDEAYDPEIHNEYNIYGNASYFKGVGNTKIHPGAFVKAGLTFEYSSNSDGIKALEVGATLDAFPRKVPIMAKIENKFIFFNLYASILFGKKSV